MKSGVCGDTQPKFCIGEHVIANTNNGLIESRVIAYNSSLHFYSIKTITDGVVVDGLLPRFLGKINGAIDAQVTSPVYTALNVGGTPATLSDDLKGLATITTQARAKFVTNLSSALSSSLDQQTQFMAFYAANKVVQLTTSRAVQESFKAPFEAEQKLYAQQGHQSIESIGLPTKNSLFLATSILNEILAANLASPHPDPRSTQWSAQLSDSMSRPFTSRLVELQSVAREMQSTLTEMAANSDTGVFGQIGLDFTGWILRN